MTEQVFEILRSAVNLARNERITSITRLKARLQALYPNSESDIKEALTAWANQANKERNHEA